MPGRLWFDHGPASRSWSSVSFALVGTAAMFAAAFASMVTRRGFLFDEPSMPDVAPAERVTVVKLPPMPVTPPVARPSALGTRQTTLVRQDPVAETRAPSAELPAVERRVDSTVTPSRDTVVVAPPVIAAPGEASAAGSSRRAVVPANPAAGVTEASRRGPLSPAEKKLILDSVIRAATGGGLPAQSMFIPPPPQPGATGTIGIGVRLPLAIFEPGPSREQRRRDSIVNADNLARLARLKARADSIKLSSRPKGGI